MRPNNVHYSSPQFRLLSDSQREEIHLAALQILERTGVTVHCQEAIELLDGAGANVSNPARVKIPSFLVEEALRRAPKNLVIYNLDGQPYTLLNGTRTYFGGVTDQPDILDPYTKKRRPHYLEDTIALVRLNDYLPNIHWIMNSGLAHGLPTALSEKVTQVQCVLYSRKPFAASTIAAEGLKSILELCYLVAGGADNFRARPFFINSVEPTTPLVHGREALEMSLLCAEQGVPNIVFSMLMSGATSPATPAANLALALAELLSHLTVIQLKKPGAPVILGAEPNIMDMKTSIFPYGSPELSFQSACLTELIHSYRLPMFGMGGATDAKVIGLQAGIEVFQQCLLSALSGADLVHCVGLADHCTMLSPELIVLTDQVLEMIKVIMGGVEVSEETLALDLIEKVGPGGNFLGEEHTLKHFKRFHVPKIMDRTQLLPGVLEEVEHSEDRLNKLTRQILETHQPKPWPDDLVKEIRRLERSWFEEAGLDYSYPKREGR